jgi:hypothetical protein
MHVLTPPRVALLLVAFAGCAAGPEPALAPTPPGEPVVRILRLETRDLAGYRDALAEGRGIMRDLGVVPVMRLEVEDDSRMDGVVVVRLRIEYPDRATREGWAERLERSQRYLAWAASLDPLRTVLSDDEP